MSTRRSFIKISALGLGGVAAAGGLTRMAMGSSVMDTILKKVPGKEKPLHRTPTYCEVCFWQCAGWVYKDSEGNIRKIVGNDDDQHCNGRFCPRGTGGIGQYYDEDRLKTPLIRTTIDGKQTYREA
ncbi:MAG: nitrate reductase, partial [Bacteroidetes bacterium HGW-Bacteroidetes-22]